VDEGRLVFKAPLEARVVYHDPCSLGRGLEVYEEPRKVLQAIPGLELVESRHNREKGECCGSGGGMRFTNPEIAATAARQTLEGKTATGAEVVVTSCPSCQLAFQGATAALGARVEVVDLVSLAARSV
jgi:Fe-S oxidoreductase